MMFASSFLLRSHLGACVSAAAVLMTLGTSLATAQDLQVRGSAREVARDCWEDVLPAASLRRQPAPIFCSVSGQGRDTSLSGDNRWLDRFQHDLSFATFEDTRYTVFETAGDRTFDSQHWRHADHWMVDIAPARRGSPNGPSSGASLLSPQQSFRFERGEFNVEALFAAGHQDYKDLQAWGEILITTAERPGGFRDGGTYGYHLFPGHFTLGCRLQADRHSICSLMDDTDRDDLGGGRLWEMSFFQHVGEEVFGGFPEDNSPWRECDATDDSDTACRDRFRLRLTEDSLQLWVNGKLYFEQVGIPDLPKELTEGPVYVNLASVVGVSSYKVVRFHWDDLTVNTRLEVKVQK